MKSKLRRPIEEPFGKAGLTVAIIALVMAMVGGAYAAGALTGKQKKEVEKIAKKFAGKPGAPGAAGTNGTNGTSGTPGTNGKDGAGVTSAAASEAECPTGGTKLTSANGASAVCNGAKGTTGKQGEPWTAGGTLPSGATETGYWFVESPRTEEFAVGSISFPIPLEAGLGEEHVFFLGYEETSTECPGSLEEPKATEGALCLYSSQFTGGSEPIAFVSSEAGHGTPGTGTGGAILNFATEGTARQTLSGSFAVTAE